MFSPEKKIINKNDLFYFGAFGVICRVNIIYGTLNLMTKSPTGLITGNRLKEHLKGLESGKIKHSQQTSHPDDAILIINNKS